MTRKPGGLPSEHRSAELLQRERVQQLAVGEQRRLARQMQALTSHVRLSARPPRTLAARVITGMADGRD
jgi:hypothetical protein